MNEAKEDENMAGAFNRREILGLSGGLLALAGITGASAQKTEAAEMKPVWALPAVGLEEHEAMAVHIRVLEKAGFKITREVGGHPTSFVAEWSQGSGGAKVGF